MNVSQPAHAKAVNYAIYGAFIMLGAQKNFTDTCENYGGGCFELVSMMCDHAPYISALEAVVHEAGFKHHGVFDYEVTEEFGRWYAEYVDMHLKTPGDLLCSNEIRRLIREFFCQGKPPEEILRISSVVHSFDGIIP